MERDAGSTPAGAEAGVAGADGGAPLASGGAGGSGSRAALGDASLNPGLADTGPTSARDARALDAGFGDAERVAPLDPVLVARLRAVTARLEPLASRTYAFWTSSGPDLELGGFHGTLDRTGNPIAPTDKGVIQQARHLWALSTWYERRDPSPALAALAQRQYSFFRDSFVDTSDGAFVFKVNRAGTAIVDAKKQLFAESYAIYALATYGRVFGVSEATELALARFASIDQARHDALFGGYDQQGDPGFLSAGGAKDANTHLHLMEAWTALYEATGDARVGERLNELVDVFATRLLQPSGYVHAEFALDFTPVGNPVVSYGHDLETAWLLLEAARVLGRRDPALDAAALSMAEHASDRGYDAELGGFFETGVPGAEVRDFDKVWWVQFEALLGLWWAYAIGGDERHLDRLVATLAWIENTEDAPAGEWFATTAPNGSAVGADYKGDEWKASYHTLRALVFAQDWMDEWLSGAPSP